MSNKNGPWSVLFIGFFIGSLSLVILSCGHRGGDKGHGGQTTFIEEKAEDVDRASLNSSMALGLKRECAAPDFLSSIEGLPISKLSLSIKGRASRLIAPECATAEQQGTIQFGDVDLELPAFDLKAESWERVDELVVINHSTCTSRTVNLDRAIQIAEILGGRGLVKRSSRLSAVPVFSQAPSSESEELYIEIPVENKAMGGRPAAPDKELGSERSRAFEGQNLIELDYFACSKWAIDGDERVCDQHQLLGRRLIDLKIEFRGPLTRDHRVVVRPNCQKFRNSHQR